MIQHDELSSARTLLFVPVSRPDRFDDAVASGEDSVVLDLEDTARSALVLAAAAGIASPVDGITSDVTDVDLLVDQATHARSSGFAGRLYDGADDVGTISVGGRQAGGLDAGELVGATVLAPARRVSAAAGGTTEERR